MAFDDGRAEGVGGSTGSLRAIGASTGEFAPVRRETGSFELVPALTTSPGEPASTGAPVAAPVLRPNLHYVFDDPNDGEPGKDRMLVHGLWELVLALALAGAGYLLVQASPGALGGQPLRELAQTTSILSLLAMASAVALRAGVPNLAVGGAAIVGGAYVAQNATDGWFVATITALGICALIGLVQALFVVGLHTPSWAVSLAVLLGVSGWATSAHLVSRLPSDPAPNGYIWFGVIAGISVLASLIGAAAGVRRGFGRFRAVADPAKRRGTTAAVIAVAATVTSMAIAGLAGALITMVDRTGPAVGTDQGSIHEAVILTTLGLGIALLGGTSAYGRRGGIFGTVFASCLMAVSLRYLAHEHPSWSVLPVAAVAIAIGLAVTRLVERYGHPQLLPPIDDSDDIMPRVHSLAPAGNPWQAPTPTGGLWSADDGWGTR